jgi:hemoglobin
MDYQHYNTSIFEKIGGIDALHDIVDRFYDKVMADASVNGFFKDANMDIQRGKMKAFLMMALGGPVKFTGKDMRKAHLRLVADGLSDVHFDAVGSHLVTTLQEFDVDEKILQEIVVVLESVRSDVLNK